MVMETETTTPTAPQVVEEEPRPIVSSASKLLLAAIGAVALARDALEDLLDRMVERGEISEKDARKLVDQLRSWRPPLFQRGTQTPSADAPAAEDLVSKADIQALHDEIAALSAKIDQMNTDRKHEIHSI